jgi:A/G-specific adenine glycosylase
MLQQTTVNAVVPYYDRWLKAFPDVRALARAPLSGVLRAWQGLGYYARARNLRAAARIVVAEHGGRLPREPESLRKLPGFGPYTTAAVLSLAFGAPYPVVDANVRRVVMRLAGLRGEAGPGRDSEILKFLDRVFDRRRPGTFNQALMELGALLCRPRNPLCLPCPVAAFCAARRTGEQEVIPSPRERASIPIEAVIGIIEKNGKFLIRKRPDSGLLGGLWEFPGGKREPGETLDETLRREIREELGVGIANIRPLTTVKHAYTRFQVTLHARTGEITEPPKTNPGRVRWVSLAGMKRYPFPSGSLKIIDFLAGR